MPSALPEMLIVTVPARSSMELLLDTAVASLTPRGKELQRGILDTRSGADRFTVAVSAEVPGDNPRTGNLASLLTFLLCTEMYTSRILC